MYFSAMYSIYTSIAGRGVSPPGGPNNHNTLGENGYFQALYRDENISQTVSSLLRPWLLLNINRNRIWLICCRFLRYIGTFICTADARLPLRPATLSCWRTGMKFSGQIRIRPATKRLDIAPHPWEDMSSVGQNFPSEFQPEVTLQLLPNFA